MAAPNFGNAQLSLCCAAQTILIFFVTTSLDPLFLLFLSTRSGFIGLLAGLGVKLRQVYRSELDQMI